MSAYEITDIKPEFDTPQVLRVFADCLYLPTEEKLRERAISFMKDNDVYAFGCRSDGAVVGVAVFRTDSIGVAELLGIAVTERHRKTGVGRTLITQGMKTMAVTEVFAETDDDAVDFYRRCGFHIEDLGFKYDYCRRYKCTLRSRERRAGI